MMASLVDARLTRAHALMRDFLQCEFSYERYTFEKPASDALQFPFPGKETPSKASVIEAWRHTQSAAAHFERLSGPKCTLWRIDHPLVVTAIFTDERMLDFPEHKK